MHSWLLWCFIAALSLTGYNILFRLASDANMFLFLMVANGVALVCYFGIGRFFPENNPPVASDNKVILWGVVMGVVIVAIEIAIFLMLKNGKSGLSVGLPSMNILTLMMTFTAGILFFKEKFSWQNGLGIAFGLLAVWLMAYKKA